MSNTSRSDSEDESRSSRKQTDERRVSTIYLVTLYGSVVGTLVGLYLAATKLVGLSANAAWSLVGALGVLALGTMIAATLRSLRNSEAGSGELGDESVTTRSLLWRTIPAAGICLLSGGLAVSGHFVAASICAFLAIAVIRYVPWKASS